MKLKDGRIIRDTHNLQMPGSAFVSEIYIDKFLSDQSHLTNNFLYAFYVRLRSFLSNLALYPTKVLKLKFKHYLIVLVSLVVSTARKQQSNSYENYNALKKYQGKYNRALLKLITVPCIGVCNSTSRNSDLLSK